MKKMLIIPFILLLLTMGNSSANANEAKNAQNHELSKHRHADQNIRKQKSKYDLRSLDGNQKRDGHAHGHKHGHKHDHKAMSKPDLQDKASHDHGEARHDHGGGDKHGHGDAHRTDHGDDHKPHGDGHGSHDEHGHEGHGHGEGHGGHEHGYDRLWGIGVSG